MEEPNDRDEAARPQVRLVKRRRSMLEDRVVRSMVFWAFGLVVILLSAVVSALFFGVIGGEPVPETSLERDLMAWESVTRSLDASATADQWQSFTLALIRDSQFQRAETVIKRVNGLSSVDQTRGANMLYCSAVLQAAKGQDEEALDTFAEVMEVTKSAYETELARDDDEAANWAKALGLHENHYNSALDRAGILRRLERWEEAQEMLSLYLENHPQAAGVFVDRATVRVQLGDKAGAEADYKEALRFVPGFPEALEGLREIGAGE